jgi:hypothetical protein
MTSATDRFGMALSFTELGLKVTFGDLLYLLKAALSHPQQPSLQTVTKSWRRQWSCFPSSTLSHGRETA